MYYLQKKDFTQCPPDVQAILPNLLQPYKPVEHAVHPITLLAAAMKSRQHTSTTKRSTDLLLLLRGGGVF